MPELPDVEMLCRYIDETSLDQKIIEVGAEKTCLLKIDESSLSKALCDSSFRHSIRYGKLAFVITDLGPALVLHFGMTGSLRYLEQGEDVPKIYTSANYIREQ